MGRLFFVIFFNLPTQENEIIKRNYYSPFDKGGEFRKAELGGFVAGIF